MIRHSIIRSIWWSAVLSSCAGLAACGTAPDGSAPHDGASHGIAPSGAASGASSPASSPSPTSSAPPRLGNVFRHPLLNPQMTVTRGASYVAWELSPPGAPDVRSELARINTATGTVEARQQVTGFVGQVLQSSGSLWAVAETGSMPATETLLKLSPATLRVMQRTQFRVGSEPPLAAQLLVVAGHWLWLAGGDHLMRLSPGTGSVTATVVLPRAASSDVSANAAGTVLIVGEADSGGRGAAQRRDPVTGALLASHPVLGVTAPTVAGPVGSAVWISEATGMMGYVQRLGTASMNADGTCADGRFSATCVPGTNGITARLADGLLWVTQVNGGEQRNYCGSPVTGRMLAPVRLPQPDQDMILAIAPTRIFYAAPGRKTGEYLRQEPVPAACMAS